MKNTNKTTMASLDINDIMQPFYKSWNCSCACWVATLPFHWERHESSLFGYVLEAGGQWGDVCAYLRFMKSGCPVLASLLCGSAISSQLLAALLWQTWTSANSQSPERRRNFHESLHLISQSWPEGPEIRGGLLNWKHSHLLPKLWGYVKIGFQQTSVILSHLPTHPQYPRDWQSSMQEIVSKTN